LADGENLSRWWHAPLVGGLATVGTFLMSHYGGATHDDVNGLKADIAALRTEVNQCELRIATVGDQDKKYTDKQVLDVEARVASLVKKKRKGDAQ